MKQVHEFSAGKHDWNTFEVGVEEGNIVIRDETGRLEFEDEDVDELVQAIDQARRRLREDRRRPTAKAAEQAEKADTEPAEDALDRETEDEEADEDTDAPEGPITTGHNPLER